MALTPDDLVAYAAIGMPEDETTGPNGGNVSSVRVIFAGVVDNVYSVSGVPGGSPVTVTVRVKGGHKRAKTQNGGGTFDFSDGPDVVALLKVISNQPFADGGVIGSITVGVPIATMKAGDLGVTRMFIDAFAQNEWGSQKSYYMKFFWYNHSATDTLLNALIQKARVQSFFPTNLVGFSLEAVKKGGDSTANRLTAPNGSAFNDADKLVPGLNLAPADYIGVWLSLNLQPNHAPGQFSYKTQCTGQLASIP